MADKDGHKRTLSVRFPQWEQPELFSRHFQDSKYVCEKKMCSSGVGEVTSLLYCQHWWLAGGYDPK